MEITSEKRRRWRSSGIRIPLLLVTTLIVVAIVWLRFAPFESGASITSPDGRFTAQAMHVHRKTLLAGDEFYIELLVTEVSTGREVWKIINRPDAGANVPDYRTRENLIAWADDSSSVTIGVPNEHTIILSVP